VVYWLHGAEEIERYRRRLEEIKTRLHGAPRAKKAA
jgi:hypothetical protein